MSSAIFKRTKNVTDRVDEVAEMVFLSDLLHKNAEYLSHGQKQWLKIGMLLVADPKLMLLDEPVAGMSVKERQKTSGL